MDHETRRVPDPFCLDRINECLRSGSRSIKLRPKAFAVLNRLIEHSGKLVTKEELLSTVWPETFVGDAVLKVTIRQLRTALNDDSNLPRFIETAHRRCYRFIGNIAECGESEMRDESLARDGFSQEFVGRDQVVHSTQEAYSLAELHLLKGELLLMQNSNLKVDENATAVARAKDCFHDAIRIARQQKATSWELRASMSLARLYQQLDKREEARALLLQIYDTFHEGFETADLREAKTLLAELS